MSIWERYSQEERKEYIKFLQVYGALTNLFRQKNGDLIPYLDSKYQETIYSRVFKCQNVDIGNTPHDVLSIFGEQRIGIGLKTWMNSSPSFQKVMQIKSYRNDISIIKDPEELVHKISAIKNERMKMDYKRLSLSEDSNIYHYITRDRGRFIINECSYPLINIDNISLSKKFNKQDSSIFWTDGLKEYKYSFADSQISQKFDNSKYNTSILNIFNVEIIEDPFSFLLDAYLNIIEQPKTIEDIVEVYLPLYSYKYKEVKTKSGLNAWNAASKNKNSNQPRPLNEIYIPIPIEFHQKNPDFFTKNILNIIKEDNKKEIRFKLRLPNGKEIPSLITQSNMKGLQSGSNNEYDENGKRYGQAALGQWLLIDVLGLKERKLVTREWLIKKGTDSVRLWRKKGDYSIINIDFAPVGSFEKFMGENDN